MNRHVNDAVHLGLQKPQKLRHMLEQHGEIGRLYLAPEAPSLRQKRKRHKGNTGKNFTEGWVEFEDKRVAKQVSCELMRSPCHCCARYDRSCDGRLNMLWLSLTGVASDHTLERFRL